MDIADFRTLDSLICVQGQYCLPYVYCSSAARSAVVSGLVSISITNLGILGLKTQLLHVSSGAARYMLSQQENDFINFTFKLF